MKSMWLLALVPTIALAQKPSGCSLLTAAEINAATGMKVVGNGHPIDMAAGKRGQRMTGCMWRVGADGMVNLSMMPAAGTKQERDADLATLRQTFDMLKAQGFTTSEAKIGEMICSTANPPTAKAGDTPGVVGCFTLTKGVVYSVGFMQPHAKLPMEKVKALADNVAKRLP